MRPSRKYWIFILVIVAVIFADIFGSFVGSWINLATEERELVRGIFTKLIPFPLVGALALVMIIGTLVSLLFSYYIIPILQARLIATVNPAYRIKPEGAKEVIYLTEVINESAEAFQRLQANVEERIGRARTELDEEHNRLAALLAELPSAVVVCSLNGQILLYNALARRLLQPDAPNPSETGPAAWVGLGRSIFGVIDRTLIAHGLDILQQEAAAGPPSPYRFVTTGQGVPLRVSLAPVTRPGAEKRELSGFILTLEDMSVQLDDELHRNEGFRDLCETLRLAAEDIRQGIAALPADLQGTAHDSLERASQQLQRGLDQVNGDLGLPLQEPSHVEDVAAESLLAVLRKNLASRHGWRLTVRAEPGLLVRLDSYALVQAVSALASTLEEEVRPDKLSLSLERQKDGGAVLTLAWPSGFLTRRHLDAWRTTPLTTDPQGHAWSLQELLSRDGATLCPAPSGEERCASVAIRLPTPPLPPRTPALHPMQNRPVYYAFDLFEHPVTAKLGQHRLSELTYVVFDTETTGLNPSEGDEIIQLAAVRIVRGRLLYDESFDQLVNPHRPVPRASIEVHGIDPALLAGRPAIEQILPAFHAFAEGSVLVAHNAAFDMKFLQLKEERTGLRFDQPVLDTLLLSSILHPNQTSHSLDSLAEQLHIPIVGRHTALGDAMVTAEVFLKLLLLLENRGIRTLEEALQASEQSPYSRSRY